MEISSIIIIVIIAYLIWAMFIRTIQPSSKTDAQLNWMYKKSIKNSDPLRPSKDLSLIITEMEKRGLFDNNSQIESTGNKILNEANRKLEESGVKEEIKKMMASDIPKKMYMKVIEIAKIKNIPEQDASTYFNKIFEDASLKYKKLGLSQNEADDRALRDALATEIK